MATYKLDDIIPPSRRREMEPMGGGPADPGSGAPRPEFPSGGRSRFPLTTVIIIVAIIIVAIAALSYFSSSKVEITPATATAAIQHPFTASQSSGPLSFRIITAQKVASQSVTGSGMKTVTTSATGMLTVYNTQSKAQRLITNTRFASPAGLVFRIHSAITVPAGSATNPGSITVKVYADQPGSSYNIGPASFTVPGLAGTPLASEVYARSTSPMSGGESGKVPTVDSSVAASTRDALITALQPDLLASIQTQIPSGYVLIPGGATTTYQELTPTPSSTTGQVDVREQGTITAVVFPNAALAEAIASSTPGLGYQGEPVTLATTSDLSLSAGGGLPGSSDTSFSFTLSGNASLVYTIDPSQIAAAVAGKSRTAAETVLSTYPSVKSAIIVLRPFWRQSFPADPSSISVTVLSP
ncbi:MAG TPA: hypothetical protein VMV50_03560 [Candidatus Paceibacterota bacterium]|nr:hypothetical protein [Candidatus Paceibacterota bacterium]